MPCENGNEHHDGTGDDFGCRVKSFNVNPYSMPSRMTGVAPKRPEPRWERGVPTDSRGMPFLGKDLAPIGIKRYVEDKHKIEEVRKKNAQAPRPAWAR